MFAELVNGYVDNQRKMVQTPARKKCASAGRFDNSAMKTSKNQRG